MIARRGTYSLILPKRYKQDIFLIFKIICLKLELLAFMWQYFSCFKSVLSVSCWYLLMACSYVDVGKFYFSALANLICTGAIEC